MKIKKHFLIFTALLAVSFSFISCFNNFIENTFGGLQEEADNSETNGTGDAGSNQIKYATLQGTISFDGAVPSELLAAAGKIDDDSGRSAMPQMDTSWVYVLQATADGQTNPDPVVVQANSTSPGYSYAGLPTSQNGIDWTITVRLKQSQSDSDDDAIMTDECTLRLNNDNSIYIHEFLVKPVTGEGKVGSLELLMKVPVSVASISVECSDTGWVAPTTQFSTITGDTANKNASIQKSGIPSGTYSVRFNFKDSNGLLLYSNRQSINIFNNCTTSIWVNSGTTGNSDPIDSSGNYIVTQAMITNFQNNTFYVGTTTFNDTPGTVAQGYNGTPIKPLSNVSDVSTIIGARADSTTAEYTILVNGSIIGTQSITAACNGKAKSIRLCGISTAKETDNVTPIHKLNGNSGGTTLTIETSVLVKIENLLITGGSNTNGNGGGIYITGGNVELTSGAVVNGNTAQVGGGVYLNTGNLYLNGTAVVGKPISALGANPTRAGTTSGTYANKATQSGGGIEVYEGTLWLGYRPPAQNETQPQAITTSGGVIYNLVAGTVETHGGGIDNNHGTLKIAHGFVSYNYAFCESGYTKDGCGGGVTTADAMYLLGDATISHNESAYGGAVYISKGRDGRHGYFTMSGGSIESNASYKQNGIDGDGGGIAIGASGSFEMSGGTIKLNTAESKGGAIYHNGSLCKITGSTATIPKGNGTNNIHLNKNGQAITISGTTGHTGTGAIAVTAQAASRGLVVLTGDSTIVANNYSKFAVTNPGMKLVNTGKLDLANIIKTINIKPGETVAANYFEPTGNTNADSTWNNSTIALNASSTQSKPFKTLSTALKFITYQNSNEDYVIIIDGMLTGHQEIQNNSDTNNPITLTKGTNIKSLTIKGKTGSSTDGFNGNSTNSGTLYTKTDLPLTFESLVIKGGASTGGYAGGLQIDNIDDDHKADVTISTGVEISSNTYSGSSSCPGGIKNYGILKLAAGVFKGNTGQYGGAIYNLGTIYMYGSTIIGDSSKSTPADSTNKSNKAGYGGGIYNGGDLYVGYKPPVSTAPTVPVPDDDFSGGIYYNYATYKGGAIGSNSSSRIFIYKGTIKCNSSPEGGGIQVYGYASNSKCELSVVGGTFTNNSASTAGGAINVEEYGVFNCEGATSIESTGQKNNDVYLGKGTFYAKVNITNAMTGTVALTPSLYNTTPVYLSEGSTGLMKANFTHFKVNDNNTSDTTSWTIKYDGKLSYGISASKAATDIPSLSGTTNTITIAGYVTKDEMTAIRTSLATLIENDITARVKLDLSGCIFPEGLPSSTFYNCANLTEVILPEGLTAIPDWIFSGCANLTSATLPSTITSIGERPFQSCNCDVTLDSSCTAYKIENGALYTIDGKSLVAYVDTHATSFTIPSSVETIVADAFDSSTHLQTITFAANSNLQTISWGAFLNCSGLTSITFPAKAELALGTSICNGCSSLENVVIPNNWTKIPQDMFWSCSHLKTIVIPVTVRSVESGVTNHCYALETIKYRGNETQFGSITVNSNNNEKFNDAAKVYNYTGN